MNSPVNFTPEAVAHIKKMMASSNADHQGLRLSVKSGEGCSGLSYLFDYVTHINPEDKVFRISEGINVFIDTNWLSLFQGSQIHYVREGLNAKLECINPNEIARCGCGESFSVTSHEAVE